MTDKKILLEGVLLEDIDYSWIKVFENDKLEKWLGISCSAPFGASLRIEEVIKEDARQEVYQERGSEGYDGDEIDVWGY